MKNWLLLIWIFSSFIAFGQQSLSDTVFYEIVLKNHPVAKQASITALMGDKELLKSKGGFDPKAYHSTAQKYYYSTQYYSLMNSGVKVPTWFGIEVKSGFEQNRGAYLNGENKSPNGGLWYGGISANLGQGMLIDQRRADLFKARIFEKSTESEKRWMLNELTYEAGYSYWNWRLLAASKEIAREALTVAQTRYNAVRKLVQAGDRPGIDTVEARIQVQNRQAMFEQVSTDFEQSKNKLATFLWNENNEPLELTETVATSVKSIHSSPILPAFVEPNVSSHPYLQVANFKIEQLEIDRRLKKENLKPQLQVQYNFLNEPINYNPFDGMQLNNFKWGVNFEMPLFLRKERGDLALAELKISDAENKLQNLEATLRQKILNAYLDHRNALSQIEICENNVEYTRRLLEAERQLFDEGESTLFLINARETTYIQAQIKLIEWKVKAHQAYLSTMFAQARLVEN